MMNKAGKASRAGQVNNPHRPALLTRCADTNCNNLVLRVNPKRAMGMAPGADVEDVPTEFIMPSNSAECHPANPCQNNSTMGLLRCYRSILLS